MSESCYTLTAEAISDLHNIARYTNNQWGATQTRQYAQKLQKCFEDIGKKRVFPKSVSEIYPDLHSVLCEKHRVFYIRDDGHEIRIVGILHQSMDFVSRLKERLA